MRNLKRLVIFALATATLAPAPASAAIPAGNLIVNPGGEADVGAPGASTVVTPSSWTTTESFTVVAYTAGGGFPIATSPGCPDRSSNFFAGGPDAVSNTTTATQLIDVSAAATESDAGGVQAALSAYIGGFGDQEDAGTVTATFLSATNTTLGSATIGPVTAADRANTTGMLLRSTTVSVPADTRTIQVTMSATRTLGSYSDAYFDCLTLTLSATTPVRFRSLAATRSPAGVVVRWRTASELRTLGFNVYREVGGRRVRTNRTLIAAKGRGSYSFLDRAAPRQASVRYWIQEVALDGSRTWHGPVRLRIG